MQHATHKQYPRYYVLRHKHLNTAFVSQDNVFADTLLRGARTFSSRQDAADFLSFHHLDGTHEVVEVTPIIGDPVT